MIYLDHAATTAPRREVLEAMWPWLTGGFGNASSHHERGQRAARALEDARQRVAAVLGARPGEIIFTSGGTEADNLAVKGIALARQERQPSRHRVLVSAIEHDAVLESARALARHDGFETLELPVDPSGALSPDTFRAAFVSDDDAARTLPGRAAPSRGVAFHAPPGSSGASDPTTVAVASVMLANNEVGTVQDIRALAEIAAEYGVPLHTDAVQAAGTLPLNVGDLGVAALTLAGHKIGTPPGIGLLWLKRGTPLRPLLNGGGHERGRRSGTSTVAGAVSLAVALELAERERVAYTARSTALRDRLISGILNSVPDAILTGQDPRNVVGGLGNGGATPATPDGPAASADPAVSVDPPASITSEGLIPPPAVRQQPSERRRDGTGSRDYRPTRPSASLASMAKPSWWTFRTWGCSCPRARRARPVPASPPTCSRPWGSPRSSPPRRCGSAWAARRPRLTWTAPSAPPRK